MEPCFTQLLLGLRVGSKAAAFVPDDDDFFRVFRLDFEERVDVDFLAASFVEDFWERNDFLDTSLLDGSVDDIVDAKLEEDSPCPGVE